MSLSRQTFSSGKPCSHIPVAANGGPANTAAAPVQIGLSSKMSQSRQTSSSGRPCRHIPVAANDGPANTAAAPVQIGVSSKMSLSRQTSSSGKPCQHIPVAANVGPTNTAEALAAAGNPNDSDLASLFKCQSQECPDYAIPPITQCQSGHILCEACREELTKCPTCDGPLGYILNVAMDKVASTVMFPCKYSSSGCPVTLLYTDKTDHEKTCGYRHYCCPCPGASCKWQGSLEQVMTHLTEQHNSITTLRGEDIVFLATDINTPGTVDWVMMQSCFHHNFILVLEKRENTEGEQMFYAIVQLIGTRKQAKNFAYRLELNCRHPKRLSWEATPLSIRDDVQSTILASNCLVFDTNIAQLFADNGNLGINVKISIYEEDDFEKKGCEEDE